MFDEQIFDKVNSVCDCLEDDISKVILKQRVLANLTGDLAYIHKMLEKTKGLDVKKAYESYQTIDTNYGIYQQYDVLAWLGSKREKRDVILFGAGKYAEHYISLLAAANTFITAIADNRSTLRAKNGIPVWTVAEHIDEMKNKYVIITSMMYRDEMRNQLMELGIPQEQIFYPDENCLISYDLDVYFDSSVWKPRKQEIFADAGSFNLFTSAEFAKYCPDYRRIYAFEPDEENYNLCLKNKDKYNLSNIELIKAGLWEENTTLHFSRLGDSGASSCVTEEGEDEVKVVSLDRVLNGDECTFIKMDIEGAELSALEGAKNTIQKWKPRLAICIYHKPDDIVEIPLLIKRILPEYKMKIRHYSTFFYDTVLYAYVD